MLETALTSNPPKQRETLPQSLESLEKKVNASRTWFWRVGKDWRRIWRGISMFLLKVGLGVYGCFKFKFFVSLTYLSCFVENNIKESTILISKALHLRYLVCDFCALHLLCRACYICKYHPNGLPSYWRCPLTIQMLNCGKTDSLFTTSYT